MTPEPDFDAVAKALGHVFKDVQLLKDALTHRSFANEHPERAPHDNERLEFLGDAVLTLSASTLLWERFPDAPEGELTRRRADLVCEASLASLAKQLGLGSALRLGRGEERSGGRNKPRLLCCALEACIAAVYLDGGIAVATGVVQRMLDASLKAPLLGQRDAKTRVQELVQALGEGTPRYLVVTTTGPDHAREFEVACVSQARELGRGVGRSKTEAEQSAARAALLVLEATSDA
ncbi:MAG: Ribonuclease [Myxococcaceae bacterium]|nr:Ribonuclease [Myxococcaceae bacterium]